MRNVPIWWTVVWTLGVAPKSRWQFTVELQKSWAPSKLHVSRDQPQWGFARYSQPPCHCSFAINVRSLFQGDHNARLSKASPSVTGQVWPRWRKTPVPVQPARWGSRVLLKGHAPTDLCTSCSVVGLLKRMVECARLSSHVGLIRRFGWSWEWAEVLIN